MLIWLGSRHVHHKFLVPSINALWGLRDGIPGTDLNSKLVVGVLKLKWAGVEG